MSERRCFVPNCESTTGVRFPADEKVRCTWLDTLAIDHGVPEQEDFVCAEHFDASDVVVTGSEVKVKDNAVPWRLCRPSTSSSEDSMKICRVCMSDAIDKSIFDFIEKQVTIMSTLMLCAFPLEISRNDGLPKYICKPCLSKLKMAYYFRLKCLDTDDILQKKIGNKRKPDPKEPSLEPPPKKKYLESLGVSIEGSASQKVFVKIDDPVEKELAEIHKEKGEKQQTKAKKEKESLQEVLAALEGNESFEIENKVTKKKIFKKKPRITPAKKKETQVVNVAMKTEPEDVVSRSEVGVFPIEIVRSIYNNTFCLADNYLFEFGLMKQGQRYVKCIAMLCPAFGYQKVLGEDVFDDKIEVKIPHNHPPPEEDVKKKLMFFNIMKKKLQNDRSLNIRGIYEDFCKHDPALKSLVPLRNVINEICKHQHFRQPPAISSFDDLYKNIESQSFEKLHFTLDSSQFYQEKFETDCGGRAIVFGNRKVIEQTSGSKLMYVDASFKIESSEKFDFQLVTVLVWVEDSYYPILFALINRKSQELFRQIFKYLHDALAPLLRPQEIVTDYESNLYYSLAETYLDSQIGGSVFYYTQNLYKKICSLNLSRDLETNSYFRNIYHMLLMLPLLPVNTILDGLNNIEVQARDLGLADLTRPILDHIRSQWILCVTPDLFCVHRLENRINENVIAPFKKLRDFLLLTKGKMNKSRITIVTVVEKLIELEAFLHNVYSAPDKKTFGRDLSSYQKKNVIRAWQYIEAHPKININNFFSKVLGYIKCMENQLWIWGFYRYAGEVDETLINSGDFSVIDTNSSEAEEHTSEKVEYIDIDETGVLMEAVVDKQGEIVLQESTASTSQTSRQKDEKHFEAAYLNYVYQ